MRGRLPTVKQVLQTLALLAVAVLVGAPVAYSTFVHSERHVVIGAHNATVAPVIDGYATIDFGPLLPQMRLPADAVAGIGVDISLGNAEVESLDQLVARDAVIASQPEGEIAAVRDAVRDMLEAALLRGIGVGVLVAIGVALTWVAIGPARRAQFRRASRRPSRPQVLVASFVGVLVVASTVLVALPERGQGRPATSWVPLVQAFPDVPEDPVLDQVEIVNGSATKGSKALVQGALETYHDSVLFYGALALRAATTDVRQPTSEEKTALVVTDRHDNIGMDPVARAIAVRAHAELVIDLGDDTSNGGTWETFSINSLAREFRGLPIVAVAGNHDQGTSVVDTMKDRGFRVLAGRPVDVAGIRFLGSSDPRSSGLVAGYDGDEGDNIAAIAKQDQRLTQTACRDRRVSVLVVHSAASAQKASASGCVDLVLSGHLHRQVGPTVIKGANGRSTTTLTTGSTGGAVYAFALGSKLRRTAQVTVVTFRDGRPVGLQPVTFQPGGTIDVADYTVVKPSKR
ncbi:metallophosphoesterase family protein [Aeromicrobium sp.]|uniref:metallophosphoesterase family protein n=1 Tax=Aeromicrobium sp. TaxID=1871063 RepID=UPI003C3A9DED